MRTGGETPRAGVRRIYGNSAQHKKVATVVPAADWLWSLVTLYEEVTATVNFQQLRKHSR